MTLKSVDTDSELHQLLHQLHQFLKQNAKLAKAVRQPHYNIDNDISLPPSQI